MSCVFCDIAARRAPARRVFEDADMVAFHDLQPKAPTHILLIPRRHIESLLELRADDDRLVGALVRRARELARTLGIAETGFRLVLNCGADAGYSVYHVHLHLLGGRPMAWPPG
jgi:histidine triad (HIT) family protein